MSFVLTLLGILLLLVFLAGIGLGVYMATNPNTRQVGWLFALWWVPGAAGATGVLMRDLVTFSVGALCFLVAGVVFMIKGLTMKRTQLKRAARSLDDPSEGTRSSRGKKTAS